MTSSLAIYASEQVWHAPLQEGPFGVGGPCRAIYGCIAVLCVLGCGASAVAGTAAGARDLFWGKSFFAAKCSAAAGDEGAAGAVRCTNSSSWANFCILQGLLLELLQSLALLH